MRSHLSTELPKELLDKLQAKQEAIFFKEALKLYVPPQLGQFEGDDKPVDAWDKIQTWLASTDPKDHCLLLLGDSGAGKTLFGQWLAREAWKNGWDKNPLAGRIPLFIPLLSQKNPAKNLIERFLKKTCGIMDATQQALIKEQPLLLLLDGVDEISVKTNLYRANELWRLPNIKVIISCRSQSLANTDHYHALFYPCDDQQKPQPQRLQEWTVSAFSNEQIDAYLKKYVELNANEIKELTSDFKDTKDNWLKWETYQTYIQQIPGLKFLLTSPFLLSLVATVLPKVLNEHQQKKGVDRLQLARINLYDHFVEQLFARQKKKLLTAGLIDDTCPIEEAFREYSKALANEMLQAGVTSVEYRPEKVDPALQVQGLFARSVPDISIKTGKDRWKIFFDEDEIKIGKHKLNRSVLRDGCPLIKLGDYQYAFLHKSLLEYFAARKLFEGAMMGASIALGYELNEKLLVDEPDILRFFAERVREDKALEQQLFDILDESTYEELVQVAAANAITILNYAGISFSQKNLHRIRIPGADLSRAILDGTDLRDADLRSVRLQSAWLNHAKLGGAVMEGVKFEEAGRLFDGGTAVAYSSDGCWSAVGSGKGDIKLWEMSTKTCVATFKGHTSKIASLAFNKDSTLLASGSDDKTVRLWDIKTQKEVDVLTGYDRDVDCVAFSPDGLLLASVGYDYNVRLWNVKTQKEVDALTVYDNDVVCVAFSPDGLWLATGSLGNTICLWDAKTKKKVAVLSGHNRGVISIAFSPDSLLLASGSTDMRLWDVKTYKEVAILRYDIWVSRIAFSPDGLLLASGSGETVYLWDVTSRKNITCLLAEKVSINTGDVNHVAFSPNGLWLFSGNYFDIRLWTVKAYKEAAALSGHRLDVNSIALSPDALLLASGSQDQTMCVWDTNTQKQASILTGYSNDVDSVAFSPDGLLLASASHSVTSSIVGLVNIKTKEIAVLSKKFSANALVFSPDGFLLAAGCFGEVCLWDVKAQRQVAVLPISKKSKYRLPVVHCLAFSHDSRLLASGNDDKTVRLWDVKAKKEIAVLSEHEIDVLSVAFSPNDLLLASGSWDKTIRLWDVKALKEIIILRGHSDFVKSVAFSPNGLLLASGSRDKTIRLWDIKTKKCVCVLPFRFSVNDLCWHATRENTYLCVASGKSIYYFEVKDHSLTLLWRIGRDLGLTSSHLDLGGVIGLDEQNELLLKQYGAIGKPSSHETHEQIKAILEQRRYLVPYSHKNPPYNLFSRQHFIMPDSAMVSMVRKKEGKGSEHIFLVLERIEHSQSGDYYIITRADFVLDQKKPNLSFGIVKGEGRVEIHAKSLKDMEAFIEKKKLVSKSWKITDKQAEELLMLLEADRKKEIVYLNVGDSALYSSLAINKERHSCVTWCESRLQAIKIDLSQQQSWLDVFFAHPANHLPAEPQQEPTTEARCSMM